MAEATRSHPETLSPAPRATLGMIGRLLLFAGLVHGLGWLSGPFVKRLLPSQGDTVQFLAHEALRLLVVLFATWLMCRLEGRSLADYGFPWRRLLGLRFWQGAAFGLASLSALLAAMAAAGGFAVTGVALQGVAIIGWAAIYAGVFLLVAVFEELRARGYGLYALSKMVGFWPAAAVSAVYFAWSHADNAHESWMGLLNAGLFGVLLCLVLQRTGNLIAPIGLHAAFDWGETYFYGVPDSGAAPPGHLLTSSLSGPAWLTGGATGPEGSVITTAVVLAAIGLGAAVLRRTRYPPAAQRARQLGEAEAT